MWRLDKLNHSILKMMSESPGSVAFSRRQVAVEVVLSVGFACLDKKLPHFLCVDSFSNMHYL